MAPFISLLIGHTFTTVTETSDYELIIDKSVLLSLPVLFSIYMCMQQTFTRSQIVAKPEIPIYKIDSKTINRFDFKQSF